MPVLASMNLLENHDISFKRDESLVYDAEGNPRSVPSKRSPSGHRILKLLSKAQRTSRAAPGDFNENVREQKLSVSSACLFGLSRHPV